MKHHCIFIGRELYSQQCPTCSGSVQVKVFSCQKHYLCTFAKEIMQETRGRYMVCSRCPDRVGQSDFVMSENVMAV